MPGCDHQAAGADIMAVTFSEAHCWHLPLLRSQPIVAGAGRKWGYTLHSPSHRAAVSDTLRIGLSGQDQYLSEFFFQN